MNTRLVNGYKGSYFISTGKNYDDASLDAKTKTDIDLKLVITEKHLKKFKV